MTPVKNEQRRELEMLRAMEQRIVRREKRERVHHLLIGGLALLSVAAFFAGHITGHQCKRRFKL